MDDDKLKDFFGSFDPELSSDIRFMSKLQRNMEAVELVKQRSLATRKRNKVAVAVAALSGVVMGVLITLLFPLVEDWTSSINFTIPYLGMGPLTVDLRLIGWMLVSVVSGVTAYNSYEIVLFKMTAKEAAV